MMIMIDDGAIDDNDDGCNDDIDHDHYDGDD